MAALIIGGMNSWLLGANEEAEQAFKEVTLPDEEIGFGSFIRPFSLA